MEDLGKKIKRLRIDKGLSQSNLHPNQSAVAQIECGLNLNPTEETLRIIVKELDISIEELVKNTEWTNSSAGGIEEKHIYSPLEFALAINLEGKISITYKSYTKYDDNGLKNKFCPETGVELLADCKNCKKLNSVLTLSRESSGRE